MPDPTFDFYPRGTPNIVTERIEQRMDDELESGATAGEAYDAMETEQMRQLRGDKYFRNELRKAYEEAGVNLVSPTMTSFGSAASAYAEGVNEDLLRWTGRLDAVPWLRKATSPAVARQIVSDDDVGVILNTQNLGAAIQGDSENVRTLYDAGVRIGQLTYNTQNLVGHGCTERVDAGLSYHGVETIAVMNDTRMIVDLSHCGRETTLDAIEVSDDPVAYTHTFSQELSDHDRGKSDAELEALRENDGYVGVLTVPFFLEPDEEADFEQVFDHIDYMVETVGIDRVGIGSDWGSWTPEIHEALHEGFMEMFRKLGFREEHSMTMGKGFGPMQRYEDWTEIPVGLERRGYDEDERRKLLGENFLDFWDRVA